MRNGPAARRFTLRCARDTRARITTGGTVLRRLRLRWLLILATLIAPTVVADAQEYPSRPVKLIVTSPAGSLVDVLGRIIANDLGERLGQTVVIDNRPGAMTKVGADAINRAPADGYTLMIG